MAIAASGAVSFSDLRTEFSGAGAISFSDLYRGGTLVKGNAANNTATNLAASVPTSGTINFTNFRSTAKGWRKTFASGATNQNASTIFGSDYGVDYPKEIVINSGVTLGATSTSEEALEISTGGIGSITVTNNGTLQGAGGAAGAAGGDAFEAFVACTFVNNGTIQAGGGGGGQGGQGGNGSVSSTTRQPSSGWYYNLFSWNWQVVSSTAKIRIYWNNSSSSINNNANNQGNTTSWTTGGWTYLRGSRRYADNDSQQYIYNVARQQTSTSSTSGGSGGSGGRGQGYNQTVANGSSGSSGGTNAGNGGSGGNGGGFGASGSNGNSGANGNASNGASGGAGAAGGKYIRGLSFVTFTNNGNVAGGTA